MSRSLCTLLAAIAACAPSATVEVRERRLPAVYDRTPAGASSAELDWRVFLADADLVALVDEALASNPDLRIALQRIEIARAQVTRATGARLPQLAIGIGAGIHRLGKHTPDFAGNSTTEIGPGRFVPHPLPELGVGLQASWEVDLWGRLRTLRGAARASYLASIEGAKLVITNLIAEIAIAYFDLLALDHVHHISTETIARQAQSLEMMRIQKEAGRTNELAVQQFEAQLASTRALQATTMQRIRERENQLSVLLGRLPRPIARDKARLLGDPAPVAPGIPSDLLRNRADIREAELQVQAARFDLRAARAAFYPRLDITAKLGYEAFDPRFLLATPDSVAMSLVGGLLAPIVNRRGIEAELQVAKAAQLQALFNYQAVILRGFAEVVTGLSAVEQATEIVAQRRYRRAAIAGTVDAADALFRAGKATYLDVLLAQQNTLDAELELTEALRDRRVASIQLYKALGGGWRGQLHVR